MLPSHNDADFNFGEWLNLPIIDENLNNGNNVWSSASLSTPPQLDYCFQPNDRLAFETSEIVIGTPSIDPSLTVVPGGELNSQDFEYLQYSQFQIPISNPKITFPPEITPLSHPSSLPQFFSTSESRWQAVVNRTPDAPFLYAVLSTKIYCRATCPSRRPLRNNVRFYDTPAEAVDAGFRPCKRCKPDDAAGEAAEQRQSMAVEKAKKLVEEMSRKGEKIPLDKLASESGLSTFYFHRVFKKRVGVTPEEWGKQCRQRASEST